MVFFPALFKHVIMVDSRFSRKISPAALLEDYNSAGENVENVKAMSWAIGQVDWILFCMSHDGC